MKNNIVLLALALLGLTTIIGCKKTITGTTPSMTAFIGGAPYTAPYCLAFRSQGKWIIEGLGGTTTTPTYPYAALYIVNYVTGSTGTFPIDSTGQAYGQFITGPSAAFISTKGSITISTVTGNLMTGTFNFKCTDDTEVSGGVFSARIQN